MKVPVRIKRENVCGKRARMREEKGRNLTENFVE